MLRAIALRRNQAVSAGLMAGAFFSKGCVDEEYSAMGADAGSAFVEEFASASELDIDTTPVLFPIVTKLPDASKGRSAPRRTVPQKNSNAGSHDASARAIEVTEPALTEPALAEPALEERPIVFDEHEAVAEAAPSELQPKLMMQDAYAAFGAELLY